MALKFKKYPHKKRPPKNNRAGKRPHLSAAGYHGRMAREIIRLASFPQLNPNPIIEIDSKGKVRYANPAAECLLPELRAQGFRHPWISDLQPIFNDKSDNPTFREVQLGGKYIIQSLNFIKKSRLLRIYAIDITERKKAEEESSRYREEMLHVMRIATLNELAASLAHEINQPLAAILTNAQAALRFLKAEKPDLEEIRGALKDIVSDDQRAGTVIKELRAFMKKEEPHREPLDMARVIEDVLALTKSDSIIRNINIKSDLSAGLPPVHGSRVQLQQVIINLINNGCEAMKETAPDKRSLAIHVFAKDPKNIVVEIADRGQGLKEGMPEKIFMPFFTTKQKGLGMGLTIARSIVEAHGGTLMARNNQGKGATVSFMLPAKGVEP